MNRSGVAFGVAVALGVGASSSVLPLARGPAALAAGGAIGAAAWNAGAALLVPLGLGLLRGAAAREDRDRRAVLRPLLLTGRFDVVGRAGRGVVVRAGTRRLLVPDAADSLPGPGRSFAARLRADPFRSRAEPSAFRVDRWAAVHGLDGRGRILGDIREVRPGPGVEAALRRVAGGFRERAAGRLGRGGSDAGDLLTALLLGDRRGLGSRERDAFRRAGLAHVLALSGLHVGILALGAGAVLRALGLRGAAVVLPMLAFLAAFAFLTGGHAPILRACGTAGLAMVGVALGRRGDPLHSLGWVGGVLLLANPPLLGDAGFRLSFLAAGLLALAAGRRRGIGSGIRARVRGLGGAVGISAVITLGTLPEIAGAFGRVSLLSPVTNVLAGIPAAAALGWGALATVTPGPDAVVARLAAAARGAAGVLLGTARLAARLPGGDIPLPAPGLPARALILGSCALLAAGKRPGPDVRRLLAVLLALTVLAGRPRERIVLFDVGQGSAVLVEGGGGAVLVDGGLPGPDGTSPGARAARYRGWSRLAAGVATHGHADHAGGLQEVIAAGCAGLVVVPRREGKAPDPMQRLRHVADSAGVRVRTPGGDTLDLLGGRLRVRSPWPEGLAPAGADENDLSLVTRWESGRVSAILPGDLGLAGEEALLGSAPPAFPRATVLVAGHHGSRDATGRDWLAAVRPALVVVSCGPGNRHGHPHAEFLCRVRAAGCALLRTDRDGTISLTVTSRGLRIRWQRGWPGRRALFPAIPLPEGSGFS